MGALTDLLGRAAALHQVVNPHQWKVNGVTCAGTGGPFMRQVDVITGGLGDKFTGPLTIPKANLPFVPLEGMAVVDLSDNTTYKIGPVGQSAFAWKLTLEANRNPAAKSIPRPT